MKEPTKTTGSNEGKLRVYLPSPTAEVAPEQLELYRIAYEHSPASFKGYEIARACTIIQERTAIENNHSIDVAFIASIAYNAGMIEGIRKERARKRGNSY